MIGHGLAYFNPASESCHFDSGSASPARREGRLRALTPGGRWTRQRGVREVAMDAQIGDRITIDSNRVGGGQRRGEVVDIIAGAAGIHYRVRWDDGHETTFFPSSDATVEQGQSSRRPVRRKAG